MENKGFIEIRIDGKKGEIPISPEIYDISEIRNIIDNVERILFPHDRKNRPTISYEIKEGSIKHIFKTSLQAIIGFNAILGQIQQKNNLEFLEYTTAQAFHALQETAKKQNYKFDISTSLETSSHLIIDSTTNYLLPECEWVEAEFYFYGDITNMGGKSKPNVHVSAPGIGSFIIETPKNVLSEYSGNPLYKPLGVRAIGRQNPVTGELDPGSLKFKDFVDYLPKYDEKYLNSLMDKAEETWVDIDDPDEWLHELRGASY